MAPVEIPEAEATKKTAGRRLGDCDPGRCAGQEGRVGQEHRDVEAGDADRS